MSESKHLLELAKRAATKAINAERNREYKVAFDQFLKAAEVLNQLIAVQKNQKIRDSYYVKAREYIKRAKEIKLLMNGPSISDEPKNLPTPPKPTPKPPAPPQPKKDLPPPVRKTTPPPPPPPKDETAKMMRGEDDGAPVKTPPPRDTPTIEKPKVEQKPLPPPREDIQLPTKTTFELLFDAGKYRECILECTKSVEAELRVRMGLFDEQLTLGMLIERAISKGMESLREFKHVNILLNRIEHENYRPKEAETQKAVVITTKILLS